jgi:hypothetical protein
MKTKKIEKKTAFDVERQKAFTLTNRIVNALGINIKVAKGTNEDELIKLDGECMSIFAAPGAVEIDTLSGKKMVDGYSVMFFETKFSCHWDEPNEEIEHEIYLGRNLSSAVTEAIMAIVGERVDGILETIAYESFND